MLQQRGLIQYWQGNVILEIQRQAGFCNANLL